MDRIEHTYMVTGPYSDLYFGVIATKPEIGQFNVEARKAVLLGDGDGPVSFTAMAEYGKMINNIHVLMLMLDIVLGNLWLLPCSTLENQEIRPWLFTHSLPHRMKS